MDCELARLRLALGREGRDGEGADALAGHLRSCPACAAAAARTDAFDAAVARAMADVPLPPGLHARLLQTASGRRRTAFRRAAGQSLSLAAAAVMAVGIAAGTYWRTRPALDTDAIAFTEEREMEAARETVEAWLAARHLPGRLPVDFDYRWHAFHGTADLGGVEVPVVAFQQGREFARVYIVKDTAADLRGLKDAQSSLCRVTVARLPGRRDVAYVILHTTDTLDPFLRHAGAVNPI